METHEISKVSDFLHVLNLLIFDEQLFRKEFLKTLNWIPKNKYSEVLLWMDQNGYNKRFPDLVTMFDYE